MKTFKLINRKPKDPQETDKLSMILSVAFCVVCGVLLIVFGEPAVRISAYIAAGVMLILGIWGIIVYLRSGEQERIRQSNMAIGLILVVAGAMLAFNPDYLKEFLPFIWGLALLFGGFQKIQYAFDEKTVKVEKWWIMLIFAAVSIILGIVSLLKPAFLGDSRFLIIGIMLVLEAVLDLTVFLLLRHALKKRGFDVQPAHAPVQTVAADPAAAKEVPAAEAPAQGENTDPENK